MKKKLLAGMSLAVIILGIVLFINTNKDETVEVPVVEDIATVEKMEVPEVEIPEETVVEEIAEEAPVEETTEEVIEEVEENAAPSFLTQEYANQVQEERDRKEWLAERKAKNEKIREQIANGGEPVEESVEVIEETVEVPEEVVVEAPVEVIQPSGNASSTSFVQTSNLDFASNPTLQALKQEMDAYIHADAGGGNEHTGLILSEGHAWITWLGRFGSHEIEVYASRGNAEVWFRCNPDEKCWEALTVIMNQVYSNGGELVSLMKDAMYNGRPDVYNVYDTPDENYICRSDSTQYGDIQTFVIVDDDIMKFAFVK